MKDVRVVSDQGDIKSYPEGRIDARRVETTTDHEIEDQINRDNKAAMGEMGAYIRAVRSRVGMTQRDFSDRIGISVDTLRNWEQGRRYPTGTARALLRIIDKAPEVAVAALRR